MTPKKKISKSSFFISKSFPRKKPDKKKSSSSPVKKPIKNLNSIVEKLSLTQKQNFVEQLSKSKQNINSMEKGELAKSVKKKMEVGKSAKNKVEVGKSMRKKRCGSCTGCMKDNCGSCSNCRDMTKFGGNSVTKLSVVAKPSLWQLIIQLKAEDSSARAKMMSIRAGSWTDRNPARSKRRSLKRVAMRNLVLDYYTMGTGVFLDAAISFFNEF